MKKKLFVLFLCLSLVGTLSAQIRPKWIKAGEFINILKFKKEILLKELSSAPSQTTGYGTLYVLSSDGALYFKDADGNATAIETGGGVDTSGTPVANDFARFTDADTIEGRSYTEVKTDLSLNLVENTALSTWTGSANITTLGTIGTGVWSGTAIANTKGGTGQNSSGWSGYAYVSSGTWSADTVVERGANGITVNGGAGVGSFTLNDSDDTNSVTVDVPSNVTGDWTLTLPAAVPGAASVLEVDTSGDATWTAISGLGGLSNASDITNGIQIDGGAAEAILSIDVNSGTDNHYIEGSSADGLSNTGLRIIVNEDGSNNSVPVLICGEAERDTDFGLSASANPTLSIGGNGGGYSNFRRGEIADSGSGFVFQTYTFKFESNTDTSSTTPIFRTTEYGSSDMTASSGTQVWMSLEPDWNQSGTAGYIMLEGIVKETSVGSGTRYLINYLFDDADATNDSMFNVAQIKVAKAHNSDISDAASTTDNAVVWQQPANSALINVYMVLDTQYAGGSISDVDIVLGNAGDNDGILEGTMNLTSDAAGTKISARGTLWDNAAARGWYYVDSATDWYAYVTSVGDNLDQTSAGQVTFYFVYMQF